MNLRAEGYNIILGTDVL